MPRATSAAASALCFAMNTRDLRRTRETGAMTAAPFDPSKIGVGLAFTAALDDLDSALARSSAVVVSSPPGTGKTTLVPPVVANGASGRIIVTQPRRVAARAAAR